MSPCASYVFRWARIDEWIPAMDMIWRTFLKFEGDVYTEEGIRNFYEFITDNDLYRAFLSGRYQMMVALDGEKIIGAASVRNGHHLSLLFVDEMYHRKGVGRTLMEHMCHYLQYEAGEAYMSLKAAPYAVEFYRKLGFRIVGAEEEYSGIRVTPMEKHWS
ncbi:MAG: GNAT family N-acetyltransferase [Lachnospiraceae bacterium]|nr:GNAT family N-acetyltransferase [Lachnospiraceae bacterium]